MLESDELTDAWRTNCRINRMVIDAASDEGWLSTLSTRGGRGVAGEFAHVHNVRLAHLERRAKDLAADVPKLDPSSQPSKDVVVDALDRSDAAIATLLEDVLAGKPKRRGFKRGIFTTLSYFIAHEAHHRGRALLTMKVNRHTLPKDVPMGIWAWDAI